MSTARFLQLQTEAAFAMPPPLSSTTTSTNSYSSYSTTTSPSSSRRTSATSTSSACRSSSISEASMSHCSSAACTATAAAYCIAPRGHDLASARRESSVSTDFAPVSTSHFYLPSAPLAPATRPPLYSRASYSSYLPSSYTFSGNSSSANGARYEPSPAAASLCDSYASMSLASYDSTPRCLRCALPILTTWESFESVSGSGRRSSSSSKHGSRNYHSSRRGAEGRSSRQGSTSSESGTPALATSRSARGSLSRQGSYYCHSCSKLGAYY